MWAAQEPGAKYGGAFVSEQRATQDASRLHEVAGPPPANASSLLSPQSPVFWIAGLVAVSVGLAAYSTTVRLGPVKASLSAGK